jgi:hypothetical protein
MNRAAMIMNAPVTIAGSRLTRLHADLELPIARARGSVHGQRNDLHAKHLCQGQQD